MAWLAIAAYAALVQTVIAFSCACRTVQLLWPEGALRARDAQASRIYCVQLGQQPDCGVPGPR